MKRIVSITIALIVVATFVVLPLVIPSEADAALVHCGRKFDDDGQPLPEGDPRTFPCTKCDLFKLGDNIVDFIMKTLMPAIATLLFIYAGFMIMFGGTSDTISQGKNIFKTTVIGIVIMLASWVIVSFILSTLAGGSSADGKWYEIECVDDSPVPSIGPGPSYGPEACAESNWSNLATRFNNAAYPRKDNVETARVKECIALKMGWDAGRLGEVSTYEKDGSNPACNYTRGSSICGKCIHSINSCHYGGTSGEGALAIDYGNEFWGDMIIEFALECGVKDARCEDGNGLEKSCKGGEATHVHVTINGCDRN